MNTENSILVGCLGSVAWVRVNGSANHENAACIKDFLMSRFDRGWRRFVVDLQNCRGIDSTFIGMLYRLASLVEATGTGGKVEVINPGERNENSICKLGLDNLIKIDRHGGGWEREQLLIEQNISQPLACPPLGKREKTELVLEAHEALVAANAENENRFCDVVEFLRQDLEAQKAGG
ncbi:MAG: STAS domain-containing protein [Verrucomicrobiales bacterium]